MIAVPSDFVELGLGLAAPVAEALPAGAELDEPPEVLSLTLALDVDEDTAEEEEVAASEAGFGGGPVLFVTGTAPEMPPEIPPGGIWDVKFVLSAADWNKTNVSFNYAHTISCEWIRMREGEYRRIECENHSRLTIC